MIKSPVHDRSVVASFSNSCEEIMANDPLIATKSVFTLFMTGLVLLVSSLFGFKGLVGSFSAALSTSTVLAASAIMIQKIHNKIEINRSNKHTVYGKLEGALISTSMAGIISSIAACLLLLMLRDEYIAVGSGCIVYMTIELPTALHLLTVVTGKDDLILYEPPVSPPQSKFRPRLPTSPKPSSKKID